MTLPPNEPPPAEYPAEDYPDGLPEQPPMGWTGPPPPGYPQNPPPGYPPPGYPQNPPPGYPPPGYHQNQPPGYPYPPPQQPGSRISVAMVFIGPLLYFMINFVVGFLAFIGGGAMADRSPNAVFGVTAVALALFAFGGGALMLIKGGPTVKGLGLGLMIGWALTTVFTAGFCTGLNPELYTS